jgi:hypothetical protein
VITHAVTQTALGTLGAKLFQVRVPSHHVWHPGRCSARLNLWTVPWNWNSVDLSSQLRVDSPSGTSITPMLVQLWLSLLLRTSDTASSWELAA